jgi:hypothetical protein
MWMPRLENDKIFGCILRSVIGVISRRTSEAYAGLIVNGALKELENQYDFLQYIQIQGSKYNEVFDVVKVQSEINNVELKQIGKAGKDFLVKITQSMGKNAGFFFLKEIKDDIPYDYELTIKELGIDLDLLQLEFITRIKRSFTEVLNNSDVLKYTITTIFETLDKEFGVQKAYSILSELVGRLSTEYQVLSHVKINDIRAIQGVDILNVSLDVNQSEPSVVGAAIQRMIQELHNYYGEHKDGRSFIEKLKNNINPDYGFRLEEIGVNLDVVQLKRGLVIKHVLKAAINVLSESSTQSYAMLIVSNILKKFEERYDFLKYIRIDSVKFSEGGDEFNISPEVESIRPSELGRSIQKVMEEIIMSLGDEAGQYFIDKFKRRLGKAYVLRIEEMGVNLHMMELKQNLIW